MPTYDPSWPQLLSGEAIIWRGRPVRGRYVVKDAKMTLTGIPMALFISVWMWFAISIPKKNWPPKGPDDAFGYIFPVFGLLFVAVALNQLVGHYLRNWLESANAEYVVTNKRIIQRLGVFRPRELSHPHSDRPIELRRYGNSQVGDIVLRATWTAAQPKQFGEAIQRMFNPQSASNEFALYAVDNVETVYRLILEQLKKAQAATEATPSVFRQ
ncbi:MAG: hypothetical protein LAN37_14060 [Acidobacteriia bacterium]|nr:hypothetical protein [Terriglobia bacterium]